MIEHAEARPHATLPSTSLLLPYVLAVGVSALASWLLLWVVSSMARSDMTGNIEPLVPLLRLGIIATPLTVALRTATLGLVAWLTIAALGGSIRPRALLGAILVFLPILEAPVIVDAFATFVSGTSTPVHVPLGLDAALGEEGGRLWALARGANVALLLWAFLVARSLMRIPTVSRAQAIAATSLAALTFLILPLMSRA